jgi:type I restriction enzyme S subunit
MKTPSEWRLVRVSEFCQVQNGFPFSSEFFTERGGTALIRVRSLKAQQCDIRYCGDYDVAFLVENGSILIGMDGDFQPCYWVGGEALLNQRVCRLIGFSDDVEPYFVYQALKQPLKEIEQATHYTTVKHLSSNRIKAIEIALPPLPEQRAIARALRAVLEAKEARRRELALERERKAALMEFLFTHGTRGEPTKVTGIGEMPQDWNMTRLEDVCKVRYGLGQPPELDRSGVPMIRATDIKSGRIVPDGVIRVKREAIPATKNAYLKQGDIVVVRSGAYTGDASHV